MDRSVLARKQLTELKGIASHLEMRGYQRLKKAELIEAIVRAASGDPDPVAAVKAESAGEQLDLDGAGERDGGTAGDDQEAAPTTDGDTEATGGGRTRRRRDDDEGTRPRVRTRTRERTQEERDADDESGDGRDAVQERDGSSDDDGDAGRQGREARDGQRDDGDDRDDRDDDARGKRRSRRERRRSKDGGQGQGGTQGGQGSGGAGSQGGQGQGQRQQGRQGGRDDEPGEVREGVLDILPEGYGFLRTTGYLPGDKDVYVSQSAVRRHGLRRGDVVTGPIRPQKHNDKVPALQQVQKVNGKPLGGDGQVPQRPDFKDMTPLFPEDRLVLETSGGPISMRIVDLMAPIGKGQRGLIVSPPKAGKTTILKELGQAIAANNPEVHLMVLLVDERPEEVTDMRRSVPGEVIASTFDRPAEDHTQIAELAIERAKRLVEAGEDVVILLDSITRLSRAYNLAAPTSGRIMSGGVESTALYPPKRFFGAARNIEDGGSLTIIATALIETGSKMDEVIFEEFKGTGNMELRLDRRLEQKRIFPAIDIEASGTRKEELLHDADELEIIWKLRRALHGLEGPARLERLIDKLQQTDSNNRFLIQLQKSNLQG